MSNDRLIRKTTGIPGPTRNQVRAIKRIMLWPLDKGLPRCPGKNKKFIKEREAQDDFSHSNRNHLCDECRCKQRAGQGTRGDFYGLGIETGHLGVGWCHYHDMYHGTKQVLEKADSDLKVIQQSGEASMDTDSYKKVAKEDAAIAQKSIKVREDLELVYHTLESFKEDLGIIEKEEAESVPILRDILARMDKLESDDKEGAKVLRKEIYNAILERTCLTEMSGGNPIPMTDATRIKLSLDIAKSLSKVKLDNFKLDSSSYIHYDELKVRVPRMMSLASNLFEELYAMIKSGEENAVNRIDEKWVKGLTEIWSDVQTGARD